MLRRTHKGLALIGIVIGFLVVAPTVAFWMREGFAAVLAYWTGVVLLVLLTVYGVYLVVTDKTPPSAPQTPYQKGVCHKSRAHKGFLLLTAVALILVLAPTVVFWQRYGAGAVVIHWSLVVTLAVLLIVGGYLILTDRLREAKRAENKLPLSPEDSENQPE